jgi:hypothetical protein
MLVFSFALRRTYSGKISTAINLLGIWMVSRVDQGTVESKTKISIPAGNQTVLFWFVVVDLRAEI